MKLLTFRRPPAESSRARRCAAGDSNPVVATVHGWDVCADHNHNPGGTR